MGLEPERPACWGWEDGGCVPPGALGVTFGPRVPPGRHPQRGDPPGPSRLPVVAVAVAAVPGSSEELARVLAMRVSVHTRVLPPAALLPSRPSTRPPSPPHELVPCLVPSHPPTSFVLAPENSSVAPGSGSGSAGSKGLSRLNLHVPRAVTTLSPPRVRSLRPARLLRTHQGGLCPWSSTPRPGTRLSLSHRLLWAHRRWHPVCRHCPLLLGPWASPRLNRTGKEWGEVTLQPGALARTVPARYGARRKLATTPGPSQAQREAADQKATC